MSRIRQIVIENHRIEAAGIPLLLSFTPPEQPRPLVLILHGMGSHKSRNSLVPPNHFGLIDAGFAVASFDGRVHGERGVPDWLDPETELPRGGLPALLEVVLGTAEDVPHVLDYLTEHPVVDADRLGAIGVSMGGLVLQHALVQEKRFRAAVLVHSGVAWPAFQSFLEVNEATRARVQALDPAGRPEAFFPTPLLLLNGADDPYFPPEGAEALLERLRPFYATAPNLLAQQSYPGVGHETVEPMRREAIAWMTRFLK